MSWKGNVTAQVDAEFRAASRRRHGIIERVSDEREAPELGPSEYTTETRRARIVRARSERGQGS